MKHKHWAAVFSISCITDPVNNSEIQEDEINSEDIQDMEENIGSEKESAHDEDDPSSPDEIDETDPEPADEGSEEEIESLGFPEYFYGPGLTVIEWPERLGNLMPTERLHIELVISGEVSRIANLIAHGELWQKKVADILSMV